MDSVLLFDNGRPVDVVDMGVCPALSDAQINIVVQNLAQGATHRCVRETHLSRDRSPMTRTLVGSLELELRLS